MRESHATPARAGNRSHNRSHNRCQPPARIRCAGESNASRPLPRAGRVPGPHRYHPGCASVSIPVSPPTSSSRSFGECGSRTRLRHEPATVPTTGHNRSQPPARVRCAGESNASRPLPRAGRVPGPQSRSTQSRSTQSRATLFMNPSNTNFGTARVGLGHGRDLQKNTATRLCFFAGVQRTAFSGRGSRARPPSSGACEKNCSPRVSEMKTFFAV